VQGDDLLYQIFTCNILQKSPEQESPFFEFIQRVCSECENEDGCPAKVKAGCGGFGIRNFLTLFLSIEVCFYSIWVIGMFITFHFKQI
jgi:4-hydroxyphenylpyruvate dioxygenase-like putative hemolysin